MEDHVEFVVHKLKGRTAAWWDRFQNMRMYQDKPPIRTWSRMKRFLQAHSFAFGGPFIRFYRSNEIAKPHQQPPVEEQQSKEIHQTFK